MSNMEYEIVVNCPDCGQRIIPDGEPKDGKVWILCSNCAAENTVDIKEEHG